MASIKRVKLTVEIDLHQFSPKDVLSDDQIRQEVKKGMQQLFEFGVTQNSNVHLKEYYCGVTTTEDEYHD